MLRRVISLYILTSVGAGDLATGVAVSPRFYPGAYIMAKKVVE